MVNNPFKDARLYQTLYIIQGGSAPDLSDASYNQYNSGFSCLWGLHEDVPRGPQGPKNLKNVIFYKNRTLA